MTNGIIISNLRWDIPLNPRIEPSGHGALGGKFRPPAAPPYYYPPSAALISGARRRMRYWVDVDSSEDSHLYECENFFRFQLRVILESQIEHKLKRDSKLSAGVPSPYQPPPLYLRGRYSANVHHYRHQLRFQYRLEQSHAHT